ncbi:aminotransferase class III-fold pyridoxal phosphate-dependent enzyme, partial [Clostridium perfringens]
DYIEQEGLVERSLRVGGRLIDGLTELQGRYELIADVRGKGFMAGAEIRGATDEESTAWTDIILERMKEEGFIIGKNGIGRNVLAVQPAMMIPEEDIEAMLSALDKVLAGLSHFVNE